MSANASVTAYEVDEILTSAADLIELFLNHKIFRPDGVFDVVEPGVAGYVFRGHANRDWRLLPQAHRAGDPFPRFTPQPPSGRTPERDGAKRFLGGQLHAELYSVRLFLEQADRLGIPTPIDYAAWRAHHELINAALMEQEYDYAEVFPDPSIVPGVALAQHHGVPTRLLDWTESPLVAAYFAAEKVSRALGAMDPEWEYFSVVCLNVAWPRQYTDSTLAYASRCR